MDDSLFSVGNAGDNDNGVRVLLEGLAAIQDTLRRALEAQETAKAQLQTLMTCLAPHLDPLREAVQQTKAVVEETEDNFRQHLLAYRAQTGQACAPGYGEVKETTVLQYNKEEALTWAKAHDLFLVLDEKAFTQYCLGRLGKGPLPEGVTSEKVAKAYIHRQIFK